MQRRAKGEGSMVQRPDGRWMDLDSVNAAGYIDDALGK